MPFGDEESPLLRPLAKRRRNLRRRSSKQRKSSIHALNKLEEETTKRQSYYLAIYVTLSILLSCANGLLYKKLLNSFRSYEFFVSQFSTALYLVQAAPVLVYCIVKEHLSGAGGGEASAWKQLIGSRSLHRAFLLMGVMDAASSTLGALGGAGTPGQLQTLINNLVIPITMALSAAYLHVRFRRHQLVGSVLIVLGCAFASLPFFFPSLNPDPPGGGGGVGDDDDGGGGLSGPSRWLSILVFVVSIIPAAMSNVFKEVEMKGDDLNVYVTTVVVSLWQEVIGFLFLPLLRLQVFGGMSSAQMARQMGDGYACFLGRADGCEGAGWLFIVYVGVNFLYNVLLLLITKHGSAVLLVVANALALPVTNVAFTLPLLMGSDAERFGVADLVGLVLVVVGFLTYSAFGLAKRFLLAQGPPGQMTYTPITQLPPLQEPDGAEATVDPTSASAQALRRPERLARFLTSVVAWTFDGAGGADGASDVTREAKILRAARDITATVVKILEDKIAAIEDCLPRQGEQKLPTAGATRMNRSGSFWSDPEVALAYVSPTTPAVEDSRARRRADFAAAASEDRAAAGRRGYGAA